MENLLISACLLGVNCKYSGKSNFCEAAVNLSRKYNLIPVCPEQLGGMPTPRSPVEIKNGKVIDCDGADYTEIFEHGAGETLKIAVITGCKTAVLKSNSPSCGCGTIYDGTFCKVLTAGNGKTAELLLNNGIKVISDADINELI